MRLNPESTAVDALIERNHNRAIKNALAEALTFNKVNTAFLEKSRIGVKQEKGKQLWFLDSKLLLEIHNPEDDGPQIIMEYKIFQV